MKTRKNIGHLSLLTASAGALGLLLQYYIRHNAFDGRNLLIPDHPVIVVLYILTALTLGLVFLASRRVADTQAVFPVTLGSHLSGLITVLCVALLSISALEKQIDRFSLIEALFGIATVAGFTVDFIRHKQGKLFGGLSYGITALFVLFYTLNRNQQWTQTVQPSRLFFPVISCIFLILGIFNRAFLYVGGKCLRQYLFFHYGAIFFCLTAFPEDPWLYGPFTVALLLVPSPAEKKPMQLPDAVTLCLKKLEKAGFEAYVVGGCVRDSLLGLTPSDYDLCTNAKPEQIAKVFSDYELVRNGEKHGTIGVVIDGKLYEITTFRTEGGYTDNRHPDWVEFVDILEADLARRDFTVNAMAYSPRTGYIDPFDGEQDLEKKILRTVGDPADRFSEDALRILRGMRFAARFGLEPEEDTFAAMVDLREKLDDLARERVFQELRSLLPLVTAEDLIRYAPIITQVVPELKETLNFDQHSPHHAYDVYTHTAYVVEAVPAEPTLRFAALLHDIGKPQTFTQDEDGRGHFYGHAAAGAEIADRVLLGLRAPTELRESVVTLIEKHMMDMLPEKKHLRKQLSRLGQPMLENIITLQEADFCSKGVDGEPEHFQTIRRVLSEVLEEAGCLTIKDLAIGGNDLMELGISAGPQMGKILNSLLEMVLEETLENEKSALLQAAKNLGGTL